MIDVPQPKAPKDVYLDSARDLHLDWVHDLELAFEKVVMRSLKRALKPVVAKFTSLTAQGEPEPSPSPVLAGEVLVSLDDLNRIRTTWAEEVAEELLPLLGETYMTGAESVNVALGAVANDLPDFVSVGAQEWLALSSNRLARVGDTVWMNMRDELLIGFQEGESIDELARRVKRTSNMSADRARTIARTEVIGASNAGAFAEAKAMEAETKTWLNTHDARTRPTHVRAGEQTVAIDEPFIVGGSRLRFPGDPLGPPSEIVNCRCTILFDDQPLCVCTPDWVQKEIGTTAAGEPNCGCSEKREVVVASADPIGLLEF